MQMLLCVLQVAVERSHYCGRFRVAFPVKMPGFAAATDLQKPLCPCDAHVQQAQPFADNADMDAFGRCALARVVAATIGQKMQLRNRFCRRIGGDVRRRHYMAGCL